MTVRTQVIQQDDKIIFNRVQDVQPTIEYCKSMSDVTQKGEFRHAARIPNSIIEKYLNINNISMQEFMDNDKHIKAIVNDPSLKALRIWKGRI